ncbi:hypothetical protein HK101_009554 [Irineochytrium annulatum]|nr:hypothetical protein HK101_009554 [Irineochytrium annulatum]
MSARNVYAVARGVSSVEPLICVFLLLCMNLSVYAVRIIGTGGKFITRASVGYGNVVVYSCVADKVPDTPLLDFIYGFDLACAVAVVLAAYPVRKHQAAKRILSLAQVEQIPSAIMAVEIFVASIFAIWVILCPDAPLKKARKITTDPLMATFTATSSAPPDAFVHALGLVRFRHYKLLRWATANPGLLFVCERPGAMTLIFVPTGNGSALVFNLASLHVLDTSRGFDSMGMTGGSGAGSQQPRSKDQPPAGLSLLLGNDEPSSASSSISSLTGRAPRHAVVFSIRAGASTSSDSDRLYRIESRVPAPVEAFRSFHKRATTRRELQNKTTASAFIPVKRKETIEKAIRVGQAQ